MKKIIVSLLIVSLILTGCNKDALSCTNTSTNIGKNIETKLIVTFKKDKVSKIVTNITTTYEQDFLSELEANYQGFNETFKEQDKLDGVKTKLIKKDNMLEVELEYDMTKEKSKNNSGFAQYETKEEYNKFLVKRGYTCN